MSKIDKGRRITMERDNYVIELVNMQRDHLDQVIELLEDARAFLLEQGIDQWQNGYPSKDTIINDMELNHGYVFLVKGQVVAYAAIIFGDDPTYQKIYHGQWKSQGPYFTVHRLMMKKEIRGTRCSSQVMSQILEFCTNHGIQNIRIDTHEDNKRMQGYVKKHKFEYCGVIHLLTDEERFAYEYCHDR